MRALTFGLLALLAGCAAVGLPAETGTADILQCEDWGAPAGHPDHAFCMASLTQKRAAERQVFAARLAAAGSALQRAGQGQSPLPVNESTAPMTPMGRVATTCFAKGERDAGMNKICYYDCLGSAVAINQSLVSICPITIRH